MDRKSITAVMLMLLMCLAGCLGATEPATEITETPQEAYSLKTTWVVAPSEIQLGEQAVFMLGVQQEGPGAFTVDYTVLQADFSPLDALDWSENEAGYQLGFTPQITGEHIVSIVITNAGTTALEPPVAPLVLSLMVTPPAEDPPILSVPNRVFLDEPNLIWFEGNLEHADIASCNVAYTLSLIHI